MKKILLIIGLLVGFVASGQVKQTYNQYGGKWKRLIVDSAFGLPKTSVGLKDLNAGLDTAQIRYDVSDSTIYIYTGWQWKAVGGSSSNNLNVGSGYRWAIPGTNNIKTGGQKYGIILDSATSNEIGIKFDSATVFPQVRGFTWPINQLAASTATNSITVGHSQVWNYNGVTSGIGHQFTSNSITSGNILDITGTSTALASGNDGLNISISGANASNVIVATGARVTVSNTGASNTNIGINSTTTGATVNYAIQGTSNASASSNFGAQFVAAGGTASNYGVTASAGGTSSIAIQASLTGASNNGQTGFFQNQVTGTTTQNGIYSQVSGSNTTNIASKFSASSGSANYAIIVPDGEGSVGIGTSTPSAIFHNVGTARFDLGSDATGDIFYRDASGFFTRLPIGSTGKKLTVVGGLPAWVDSTASAFGANTALSNLASVAINTSLLPGTDNAIDLGSTTKGWRKNYLSAAGVIDFGNGLQTITHSGASKLTIQTSGADDTLQILTAGSNRAVFMVSAPSYAAEMGTYASGTSVKLGSFSGASGVEFSGTGYFSNSTNQLNFLTTASVFNQNSNDVDFQVKGDGNDNLIYGDASTDRAGVKTATPNSSLQVNGSFAGGYVAKTGTYTATEGDFTIEATANTFTITLPTSVGIPGRIYNIVNSGAGVITIATTSSQTFVNVVATPTTLTLSAVGTYQVQSNGANWIVLSIN